MKEHGWEVKLATRKDDIDLKQYPDIKIHKIDALNKEALDGLNAKLADAVVLMFTDIEKLQMCELIYEHVGTKEVIVRLNHRYNFDKFPKLIHDGKKPIKCL